MFLLGEGSEATETYIKYVKNRLLFIRSLQFDQKVLHLSFRPEKFDLFTGTRLDITEQAKVVNRLLEGNNDRRWLYRGKSRSGDGTICRKTICPKGFCRKAICRKAICRKLTQGQFAKQIRQIVFHVRQIRFRQIDFRQIVPNPLEASSASKSTLPETTST